MILIDFAQVSDEQWYMQYLLNFSMMIVNECLNIKHKLH